MWDFRIIKNQLPPPKPPLLSVFFFYFIDWVDPSPWQWKGGQTAYSGDSSTVVNYMFRIILKKYKPKQVFLLEWGNPAHLCLWTLPSLPDHSFNVARLLHSLHNIIQVCLPVQGGNGHGGTECSQVQGTRNRGEDGIVTPICLEVRRAKIC